MSDRPTMSKRPRLSALRRALPVVACAQQKVTFQSNWFAQAEHGGLYKRSPRVPTKSTASMSRSRWAAQVNGLQFAAAGQVTSSWALRSRTTRHGSRVSRRVTSAPGKGPDPVVAHNDVKTFADLKSKTVLVSTDGQANGSRGRWQGSRTSRPPLHLPVIRAAVRRQQFCNSRAI